MHNFGSNKSCLDTSSQVSTHDYKLSCEWHLLHTHKLFWFEFIIILWQNVNVNCTLRRQLRQETLRILQQRPTSSWYSLLVRQEQTAGWFKKKKMDNEKLPTLEPCTTACLSFDPTSHSSTCPAKTFFNCACSVPCQNFIQKLRLVLYYMYASSGETAQSRLSPWCSHMQ